MMYFKQSICELNQYAQRQSLISLHFYVLNKTTVGMTDCQASCVRHHDPVVSVCADIAI